MKCASAKNLDRKTGEATHIGMASVFLDLGFSNLGPALALGCRNLLTRFSAQDALTFRRGGTIGGAVTIAGALQQSLHLLQP